ncbi:hypothetical protein AAE478_000250 [Parahypoxylon ruwenzoriense]
MSSEPTPTKPNPPERSDSSSSSSAENQEIHTPIPVRPRLPNRKSSGTLIVPRDSYQVGPVEPELEPDDVRAMSPRRTSEDIEVMGREAREELHKHARALQDSLLMIFNRIEAVREEHDKLDNHNKFLQKYIGDLMSTRWKLYDDGGRVEMVAPNDTHIEFCDLKSLTAPGSGLRRIMRCVTKVRRQPFVAS